MANEFYYCVSLYIVHPTVDPKWITRSITSLHPKSESMVGTELRAKDGKLRIPNRKAVVSHWLAELHDEEKLHSGMKPLSIFILEQLLELERYHDLFAQLRQEGRVVLRIGWFSESNYSAGVFHAEMLKKCGDLGIDIEINCYGPNDQISPLRDAE